MSHRHAGSAAGMDSAGCAQEPGRREIFEHFQISVAEVMRDHRHADRLAQERTVSDDRCRRSPAQGPPARILGCSRLITAKAS
jgi:hypothetical protein